MKIFHNRQRSWTRSAVTLGISVLAGIAAGWLARMDDAYERWWILLPLLLIVGTVTVFGTLPWWKRLDDFQRQGQSHSWFWGSLVGAVLMLIYLVTRGGVDDSMVHGALFLFLAQNVGFAAVYAMWRLRSMGPAE